MKRRHPNVDIQLFGVPKNYRFFSQRSFSANPISLLCLYHYSINRFSKNPEKAQFYIQLLSIINQEGNGLKRTGVLRRKVRVQGEGNKPIFPAGNNAMNFKVISPGPRKGIFTEEIVRSVPGLGRRQAGNQGSYSGQDRRSPAKLTGDKSMRKTIIGDSMADWSTTTRRRLVHDQSYRHMVEKPGSPKDRRKGSRPKKG